MKVKKEIRKIGCCGAYCGTCQAFVTKYCKGCKLGYEDGKRDINKSRCKIKSCCFKDKKLETCADCSGYLSCKLIQDWYKKGYKYKRYKQAADFIREKGYKRFLEIANKWRGPYGKIERN
jgi:hypothetical protein